MHTSDWLPLTIGYTRVQANERMIVDAGANSGAITLYALTRAQPQDPFRHLEQAAFKATEIQNHGGGYDMVYWQRG